MWKLLKTSTIYGSIFYICIYRNGFALFIRASDRDPAMKGIKRNLQGRLPERVVIHTMIRWLVREARGTPNRERKENVRA